MGKPTDAASDGCGTTATVLQFPALVAAPVENIRWHGRYPRGVRSLTTLREVRKGQQREAERKARIAQIKEQRQEDQQTGSPQVQKIASALRERVDALWKEATFLQLQVMQLEDD